MLNNCLNQSKNILVKIPLNLKIFIYKSKISTLLKFVNKFGVIKKKFNTNNIRIDVLSNNTISLTSTIILKPKSIHVIKNTLNLYKIIIEQISSDIFKKMSDRFLLEGIGFKIWKKKNKLKLKVGYSCPVFLKIPVGIKVSLYKQKKITVSSINLQYLRTFGQKLKSLKFPDHYKKKGIREFGLVYKIKAGKKSR